MINEEEEPKTLSVNTLTAEITITRKNQDSFIVSDFDLNEKRSKLVQNFIREFTELNKEL